MHQITLWSRAHFWTIIFKFSEIHEIWKGSFSKICSARSLRKVRDRLIFIRFSRGLTLKICVSGLSIEKIEKGMNWSHCFNLSRNSGNCEIFKYCIREDELTLSDSLPICAGSKFPVKWNSSVILYAHSENQDKVVRIIVSFPYPVPTPHWMKGGLEIQHDILSNWI